MIHSKNKQYIENYAKKAKINVLRIPKIQSGKENLDGFVIKQQGTKA